MDRGLDVIAGLALIVAAGALSASGVLSGLFVVPLGSDELYASSSEEPYLFAAILLTCLAAVTFGAGLATGRLGSAFRSRD